MVLESIIMPWSNNPKQNVWEEYSFYIAAAKSPWKRSTSTEDDDMPSIFTFTASNGFLYHGARNAFWRALDL